jgi:hypothetical protein
MSCTAQTPGDGTHLCRANAASKLLKLTHLPVDLSSCFLQLGRAVVNLVTHWNAPKMASEIKRLENTQSERSSLPYEQQVLFI